jgi:hypothetical protein
MPKFLFSVTEAYRVEADTEDEARYILDTTLDRDQYYANWQETTCLGEENA